MDEFEARTGMYSLIQFCQYTDFYYLYVILPCLGAESIVLDSGTALMTYEFETRAGVYSLILILRHPGFNLLDRQTMSLARVLRVHYIQEYE